MHWGGFFVLEIDVEDKDLIRHPDMSDSSPEELEPMGRIRHGLGTGHRVGLTASES